MQPNRSFLNDRHRETVKEQARSAGFEQPRLINLPAAVALAHFAANPTDRAAFLALELGDERFDVTALRLTPERFEVLGANGVSELAAEDLANPEKLFAAIEKPIRSALADAELKPNCLDAILLGGDAAPLARVNARIAATFGREGSLPARLEHAAALGAAMQAKILTTGVGSPGRPHRHHQRITPFGLKKERVF